VAERPQIATKATAPTTGTGKLRICCLSPDGHGRTVRLSSTDLQPV